MRKTIEIPILNDEYKVIVSWASIDVVRREMRKYGYPLKGLPDKEYMASVRGVCCRADDCHPFIVLKRRPRTSEEIGTLAHEAVHAISDILKYTKVDDEEVFAMSVGAIVRAVLEFQSKR